MKAPTGDVPNLVVTNGKGRLFVQTVLPSDPQVKLVTGEDLYSYGGRTYNPERDTGPAPECRIEISPSQPETVDYFLHVLTAADADTESVQEAVAQMADKEIAVTVGDINITFAIAEVGGEIEISGHHTKFADQIHDPSQ